jgi:ParB family chromosome partitioning protein
MEVHCTIVFIDYECLQEQGSIFSPNSDGLLHGDFLRNHFPKEVRHIMTSGNFALVKEMGASVADTVKIRLRTEVLHLSPDIIDPDPAQPRKEFGEEGLMRLAESFRKFSQLHPVLVRKEGSSYVLVTGERRWRAARLAGMATIQCLVCKSGDVRSVQLIENLLREDLLPIEEARGYQAIMDREGWGLREMAKHLHLDPSRVSKALKLLKLPEEVQKSVDRGEIPPTTAYEIAKRPRSEQRQLAKDAAAGKIRGGDLRQKLAPTPRPATSPPTLTFGKTADVTHDWDYQYGKINVSVTGFRNQKEMVTALERAVASARAARLPLVGGLG